MIRTQESWSWASVTLFATIACRGVTVGNTAILVEHDSNDSETTQYKAMTARLLCKCLIYKEWPSVTVNDSVE